MRATVFARDARRITEVEHRIALAAQQDALMIRRQETGSPKAAEKALLGETGFGVHNYVTR